MREMINKKKDELLKQQEEIAEEIAEYISKKSNSSSIIQQAMAGDIPPTLMKKYVSNVIQIQMIIAVGDKNE